MSQNERLIKYLQQGRSITSKQAYDQLGITQLGRCLDDLEKAGHTIDRDEWITVADREGNPVKVKNYKLIPPGQQSMFAPPTKSRAYKL